jgi:hypothetical protein
MLGWVTAKGSEPTEPRGMKKLLCRIERESRRLIEGGGAVKVMIKATGLAIIAVASMVRLCAREVIENWARWTTSEIEGEADRRKGPKDRKDGD